MTEPHAQVHQQTQEAYASNPPTPAPTTTPISSTQPAHEEKQQDNTSSYALLGVPSGIQEGSRLFEQFLVVGLPHNYHVESRFHNEKQAGHKPQVLYKYPTNDPLLNPLVADFCFPDGLVITSTQRMVSGSGINSLLFSPLTQLMDMEHSFIFVITEASAVFYGFCIVKEEPIDQVSSFFNMPSSFLVADGTPSRPSAPSKPLALSRHQYDVSAPRAYCLISRFPFAQLHFHVLFAMIERERLLLLACYANDKSCAKDMHGRQAANMIEYYHNYDYEHERRKKASSGGYLTLSLPSMPASEREREGEGEGEGAKQLLEQFYCSADDARMLAGWGLFYVFEKLATEDIMLMFTYIMQEQSVLVVCKQPGVLSAVTLSMISLLKPFSWQCALVPILPRSMINAVDSPVPFFMGSSELPSADTLARAEFLLVDLTHHTIVKPNPRRPVPSLPGYQKLYDTILFHKQQFQQLQQAPLQHRKYKFVEDILNTFGDYQTWITEEISYAILSASSSSSLPSSSSSSSSNAAVVPPALQFLDSRENDLNILQHFSASDRDFFTNFMHTQMFSVHAHHLFSDMEERLLSSNVCLQKLKDLIVMEEQSREVLKHYSKTGVQDKQAVSKSLKETEAVLAMLKESKKQ